MSFGSRRFERALRQGVEKPSVRRTLHDPSLYEHPWQAVGVPLAAIRAAQAGPLPPPEPPRDLPRPTNHADRTLNELRPRFLREIVGQRKMLALIQRLVASTVSQGRPLDHMLLVGSAGTGKTTIANAVANEIGSNCYQIEAPVSHDTLLDLCKVCKPFDVVFIDEVHMQAAGDRRGRTGNTTPEVLLGVLEDRVLISGHGPITFPAVTFIGATTDEGLLPDAFVSRFPIRPAFDPYTVEELTQIATNGAQSLGLTFNGDGARMFAQAARGTPRAVTNYLKNARALAPSLYLDDDLCRSVLADLNRVTEDGLTLDQQRLLKWLLQFGKKQSKDGDPTYQASVSTLATAIGKGRDTKSIQLRVEPWLLQCGLLQILPGGRALTDAGIKRARSL